MRDEDFDLASVVLYPRDLPDALLKLAQAGKHFTVDKQFAVSSKDLYDVVRTVRRNELTTFIQYPWRFHPAMRDLRRFIDEGILGRPLDVESRQFWFQIGGPMGREVSGAYRLDTQGGGVLHHMGCHHLDLMRGVMGCEVKSVQATMGRPVGNMEEPLEDVVGPGPGVRERRLRQSAQRLHEARDRGWLAAVRQRLSLQRVRGMGRMVERRRAPGWRCTARRRNGGEHRTGPSTTS